MSVRTSAVVAVGLLVLSVVGVGTVFGESIVAAFAPPTEATPSTASRLTAPGAPLPPGTLPGTPRTVTADAGAVPPGDGSS